MSQNNAIEKFINFISVITEKPGMFLINDVEGISLVILGYKNGSEYNQFLSEIMNEFRNFINKEFDTIEDFDWARLIRFYAVDNKNSINLFKLKFEKFIRTNYPHWSKPL